MSHFSVRRRWRRRVRQAAQLAALGVAGYFSIATSPIPSCRFGVWPFDGASAVPLETSIVFQYDGAFPADLPALTEEAAALYLMPERALVATTVSVDLEAGTVTLTPASPLLAGRRYLAYGVDLEALTSAHYVSSDLHAGSSFSPVEAQFTTASSPAGLLVTSPTAGTVVVAFSEAMDLASVNAGTLMLSAESADAGDTVSAPWTTVSLYDGQPNQLAFAVEADEAHPIYRATLSTSLRGSSGVALDGDRDETGGEPEDSQALVSDPYAIDPLNQLTGEVACARD